MVIKVIDNLNYIQEDRKKVLRKTNRKSHTFGEDVDLEMKIMEDLLWIINPKNENYGKNKECCK